MSFLKRPWLIVLATLTLLLVLGVSGAALAAPSPLHPTFPMLDEHGVNVMESGRPVSTIQTCGSCHDAKYIKEHSYHADVGLNHFMAPGQVPGGRAWDMSRSLFGQWDPVIYRYLTPKNDKLFDLGTADWIKLFGARHSGGGPAVHSQNGFPLEQLPDKEGDPETNRYDPETGEPAPWDWDASGTVEMNCFLCHLPQPDNDARIQALEAGNFQWANTATLAATGIVEKTGDTWQWNREAFMGNGDLISDYVTLQDPSSTNCGQCHGAVHESKDPLKCEDIKATDWNSMRTGQIFSGQRLSDSGMNMANKDSLTFPWDIHAERNLKCTDCHFSLNNPVYHEELSNSKPDYLNFEPRRQSIGSYLYRPSHEFAKGDSAQHTVAPEFQNTMRRCEDCHSLEATHEWLPYKDLHMNAVSCESCHIPKMYTASVEQNDWTVIGLDGMGQVTHRGVEGDCGNPRDLMTGYEPILLPQAQEDGKNRLAPYNLISSWYWVHDDPERPVRQKELKTVYLNDEGGYQADIMATFDTDGDGDLDEVELRLDTASKTKTIAQRLEALGLENPRIKGEVQPYSINHNVVTDGWVTRDCKTCHSDQSRVAQPMVLGPYTPGNVQPEFINNTGISVTGGFATDDAGALVYKPNIEAEKMYLPGYSRFPIVDIIGWLAVLGTLLGIIVHGGLRIYNAARHPHTPHETQEVYMYTAYERLWHWLQAIVILLLVASGIIIHRPNMFTWADFDFVVPVHNVLAVLLLLNAVFSLFYHFASGEIKQYLPEPHGFFRRGIMQVEYYIKGIFQDESHPFEKTPEHKLNPLQQVTYFAILNILLPLQILTGIVMWGSTRWLQLAFTLPYIGPIHTLVAWFFVAFVIMHVYLTTTGSTPTADIEAMITGWDKVEVHEQPDAA